MSDPMEVVIDLGPPTDGVAGWNDFILRVPHELRRRLQRVIAGLLAQHPGERVRELIHGMTVAEFIRLYESVTERLPSASGETEGKKWALYDSPTRPTD